MDCLLLEILRKILYFNRGKIFKNITVNINIYVKQQKKFFLHKINIICKIKYKVKRVNSVQISTMTTAMVYILYLCALDVLV